jgi:hypothetical protein
MRFNKRKMEGLAPARCHWGQRGAGRMLAPRCSVMLTMISYLWRSCLAVHRARGMQWRHVQFANQPLRKLNLDVSTAKHIAVRCTASSRLRIRCCRRPSLWVPAPQNGKRPSAEPRIRPRLASAREYSPTISNAVIIKRPAAACSAGSSRHRTSPAAGRRHRSAVALAPADSSLFKPDLQRCVIGAAVVLNVVVGVARHLAAEAVDCPCDAIARNR